MEENIDIIDTFSCQETNVYFSGEVNQKLKGTGNDEVSWFKTLLK